MWKEEPVSLMQWQKYQNFQKIQNSVVMRQ